MLSYFSVWWLPKNIHYIAYWPVNEQCYHLWWRKQMKLNKYEHFSSFTLRNGNEKLSDHVSKWASITRTNMTDFFGQIELPYYIWVKEPGQKYNVQKTIHTNPLSWGIDGRWQCLNALSILLLYTNERSLLTTEKFEQLYSVQKFCLLKASHI